MSRILIIEDDLSIHKIMKYELMNKDYQVDSLYDGKGAVTAIIEGSYDLVLIDWMLPHKSGVAIIEEVRANGYHKPLILLTARSEQEDIIQGLKSGADDYLLKPFQAKILIARIEAHLRRFHNHFPKTLKFSDITMDIKKHEVKVENEHVSLTKVEYDVLRMFLESEERVLSREELLLKIWKFAYDGDTRLVDIHIFKLKGKMKQSKTYFKSVRGVGYKLVEKDEYIT